jgi:hypothetical protein
MELSNSQRLPVPQDLAWQALNDPDVLKACIPGCEQIDKVSDTEYAIAMTAAVGPVKAKFKGKLSLFDLQPPSAYSLKFDGQGGVAGFGSGTANVSLAPEGTHTMLNYNVKAQVGGKLAQVGSRLIDGAARKMADDFFTRFNTEVASRYPEAAAAAGAAAAVPAEGAVTGAPSAMPPPVGAGAPASSASRAPSAGTGGVPLWLRIAIAVAIAVALYYGMSR